MPQYFSATDSAGSIIRVWSFVFMLMYVPSLSLVAFLIFFGIMILPFSSIFAVASLISFPTYELVPTFINVPTFISVPTFNVSSLFWCRGFVFY